MKILFVVQSPVVWKSGIWFHRVNLPSKALKKRGHKTKLMALGSEVPDYFLEWADTVIFGRTYGNDLNPLKAMRKFKKNDVRVLYDIDDDLWTVNPENPSHRVSNAQKDQYEGLIRECDAVITPSEIIEKKIKKFQKDKPVFICPNMIDRDYYKERKRQKEELVIGYGGASSHWKDLQLIIAPLLELQKKYDFVFTLQGMVSGPLEGQMYAYSQILARDLQPEKEDYMRNALEWYKKLKELEMYHIPFYPPELYPTVLARADMDIGLIPLSDNEFNRAKSCIKFYEYAGVGTPTLASNVLPYKKEVDYLAKNTQKDWTKKIEKLIVDKEFREDLLKKQRKWVLENRTTDNVGLDWELACQRPGGLKVRSQQK